MTAVGGDLPEWNFASTPLRLQFSDYTFGALSLPLDRRAAGLASTPLARGELPAPPRSRTPRSVGYVVYSHPVAEPLPVLRLRAASIIYVPKQYRRHSADLRMSFSDFLGCMSAKSRSTLKRKVRKFGEQAGGAVEFRAYRSPAELEEFFEQALPLSRGTYQHRLFRSGLPEGADEIAAAKVKASEDAVRAYILFVGNAPVSYLYCSVQNRVVKSLYLGYDPDRAALSPGTVLEYHALADLYAEQRFDKFDFGEGEGQHKSVYATESIHCANVFVLDWCARSAVVVFLHHTVSSASRRAGLLLDRLGLKTRMRRLLRRS